MNKKVLFLMLLLCVTGCSKLRGPEGPMGPKGDIGLTGPQGEKAKMYTYSGDINVSNLSGGTTLEVELPIDITTNDVVQIWLSVGGNYYYELGCPGNVYGYPYAGICYEYDLISIFNVFPNYKYLITVIKN